MKQWIDWIIVLCLVALTGCKQKVKIPASVEHLLPYEINDVFLFYKNNRLIDSVVLYKIDSEYTVYGSSRNLREQRKFRTKWFNMNNTDSFRGFNFITAMMGNNDSLYLYVHFRLNYFDLPVYSYLSPQSDKTIKLKINNNIHEDILAIDNKDSSDKSELRVDMIYWSKQKGLVGLELSDSSMIHVETVKKVSNINAGACRPQAYISSQFLLAGS